MDEKDLLEDKKNKTYLLTLKNGTIVKLTKQDVIDNNLYKLADKVPNLKILDKLSNQNPLKKLIQKLEREEQNKFFYYKLLSYLIIVCLCLVQIYEILHDTPQALSMSFITIWGSLLIIFLYKKQQVNRLSLLTILKNKSCFFVYSYLFNISLTISLSLFVVSSDNIERVNNITDWRSFITYPIIVTSLVSFLGAIHNISILYKTYILRIYLKFISHTLFICSLIFIGLLFTVFWNLPLKEIEGNKIYIIVFLYSICYISAVAVNNIILLMFMLIKMLAIPSK